MSLLDISVIIIFLFIGSHLKNFFIGFSTSDKKNLNYLFWFHITISVLFNFYVSDNGGDALYYWQAPLEMPFSEILDLAFHRSASGVIYLINYFPSKILSLSFLTGNIMYATFGFLGFIYFFKIIKTYFKDESLISKLRLFTIPLIPWIWFLPNFHFWSSGIGKDTLLFTAIAMFIYGLTNIRKKWLQIIISIIIAITIRPHILLFLLVAFGIGFILDGNLKGYQKLILFLGFVIGFASILNFVLQFIQLESLETSAINEYTVNKYSSLNTNKTESGIDISTYFYPFKVFTFLYRPLFLDIFGVLAIVSSFENLVLLIFSVTILFRKPFKAFKKANYLLKGSFLFFLISSLSFSLILGNLGIMLRQKNMLMPWLVIVGLWVLYLYQQPKLTNENATHY